MAISLGIYPIFRQTHMVITHSLTGNAHPRTMQLRKREGNRETVPARDGLKTGGPLVFFFRNARV